MASNGYLNYIIDVGVFFKAFRVIKDEFTLNKFLLLEVTKVKETTMDHLEN